MLDKWAWASQGVTEEARRCLQLKVWASSQLCPVHIHMSCSSCPGAQVLGHSRAPTLHHVMSEALANPVSCVRLRGSPAMREEGRSAEADALSGAFRPALPGMLAHALATAGHSPEVSTANQVCRIVQHGCPASPVMLHLGPLLNERMPQCCHTCHQILSLLVHW